MAGYLDWKYILDEQIDQLESCNDEAEVKRMLYDIFNVSEYDEMKQKIAVNFHFFNYAFCKENAFDSRRTSTFLSIMNELLQRDSEMSSVTHTMDASFEYFKELVLKHSIEAPPKSVQIFLPSNVEPILSYALSSYFRNYKLYHYVFGTKTKVILQQVAPYSIEYPVLPRSLDEGTVTEPIQN